MCFCLVHFHIDSLLPGFCWLLERGVAKSLSFCWQKLQDCAHACVSPCPRLFCPHSWWVGGKRQWSLQRAWTWFLVARHITFLCSPKIFKKFVISLILGEWIYFVLAVLKCIVSSPVLLCVNCLAPASLWAFEEPFLSTAPSCLQRALKQWLSDWKFNL